eukprot:1143932-Pelagomonas_calceolata.AAC.5
MKTIHVTAVLFKAAACGGVGCTASLLGANRQLLQMHGVTLEVAKSDFLCLLSAAHRGAQWKSGASTNAHLLEPISVFKPKAYNNSTIEFEEYSHLRTSFASRFTSSCPPSAAIPSVPDSCSGWGIEGKDIQFVSATPVLPLESPLLTVPKSHEDEGKDETALGVGIGVGVGGGLLLIFLLLGLAVVRKRRISRYVHGTLSACMDAAMAVSLAMDVWAGGRKRLDCKYMVNFLQSWV